MEEYLTAANALTDATKTPCVTYVTSLIDCLESSEAAKEIYGIVEPNYYGACEEAFEAIKAEDANNAYILAEDECWGPTDDLYVFYEFTYSEFQSFKSCLRAIPDLEDFPDECSGYYESFF
jgi:hypothetical protein